MKHKVRIAALSASVLIVLAGGHAIRASSSEPGAARTSPIPLVEASVTVPDVQDPVVVPGAVTARGISQAAGAVRTTQDIRPEVMNAYLKAVAVAPAACHLSVSLLAAIGQVESGNLAGHAIDAQNRVSPRILGPVLDGGGVASVEDTDNGRWDGDEHWDRALGPMQFVPASWRVVGLDLDEDGIRDPQDVFDAAGAAMVYLCASGRDLSTAKDLDAAVLAYNHSAKYLHVVLAWKTVFDAADITGLQSQPEVGAWAMPPLPRETLLSGAAGGTSTHATRPRSARTTAAGHGSSTATPVAPGSTKPSRAAAPTGTPTTPSLPASPAGSQGADPEPGTAPDPTSGPADPSGPTDPTDPLQSCLPDPSEAPLPGEPEPSVIPPPVPGLPGLSGIPGDGTVPDPCALLTPSASADAASEAPTG